MKNLSIFSMKVTINQEGRINEKILEQIAEDHSKEVNKEYPIIYDDLKSIETSRKTKINQESSQFLRHLDSRVQQGLPHRLMSIPWVYHLLSTMTPCYQDGCFSKDCGQFRYLSSSICLCRSPSLLPNCLGLMMWAPSTKSVEQMWKGALLYWERKVSTYAWRCSD